MYKRRDIGDIVSFKQIENKELGVFYTYLLVGIISLGYFIIR